MHTNDVKDYRRYLRTLLARYCASWALTYSVFLEFNLRWNLRMMAKNHGSLLSLGGHCLEYHGGVDSAGQGRAGTGAAQPSSGVAGRHRLSGSVGMGEKSGLARSLWEEEADGGHGVSTTTRRCVLMWAKGTAVSGRTRCCTSRCRPSDTYTARRGERMPEQGSTPEKETPGPAGSEVNIGGEFC
ncbi:unnamed protein product [Ectocarpus sp. 12 AP-2014]